MTVFPITVVAAVVAGYLLGGRLRNFDRLQLHWWGLAVAGFLMQLAPVPELSGGLDEQLSRGLLIASYPPLLAFAAKNVAVVGMPTIFVGLALNFAVIAVNGSMPVSEEAIIRSGQDGSQVALRTDADPKHHLLRDGDRLTILADVIGFPPPFREVVSVGDLVAYFGVASLICSVMQGQTPGLALPSRPAPRIRRLRRSFEQRRPAQPMSWA